MNFLHQAWEFYKILCITGMSIIFIAMILGIPVEVKSFNWIERKK